MIWLTGWADCWLVSCCNLWNVLCQEKYCKYEAELIPADCWTVSSSLAICGASCSRFTATSQWHQKYFSANVIIDSRISVWWIISKFLERLSKGWKCNQIFIGPESDHWQCLSLTDWLTNWLLFSKLFWCDPGVWRCQLKTCWCCNCCWWWWCWQQFVADLKLEVSSKS